MGEMAFSPDAPPSSEADISAEKASGGRDRGRGSRLHTGWDAVARARERIAALQDIIGPLSSLESSQESESPAKALLGDDSVAVAILARFTSPKSGHGQDALCQWLYDTFQTKDPDLQDVVLRYIPALCGIYLPRITMQGDDSLAGFEAVLLALYTAEMKARNGLPVTVSIPDLSQPSLYHAPRNPTAGSSEPTLGRLSAPLEPQETVIATKRASIVAVALNLFLSRIAFMPAKAKIEACQVALRWASFSGGKDEANRHAVKAAESENTKVGLDLEHHGSRSPGRNLPEIEILGPEEIFSGTKTSTHADFNATATVSSFAESENVDFLWHLREAGDGARIPLQWELLQPTIRILSHCLLAPLNSEEVKEAASIAIEALQSRAFHDLIPEAMLATRSLVQLDMASRTASKALSTSGNSASSSSKPRKPENLLVSK